MMHNDARQFTRLFILSFICCPTLFEGIYQYDGDIRRINSARKQRILQRKSVVMPQP